MRSSSCTMDLGCPSTGTFVSPVDEHTCNDNNLSLQSNVPQLLLPPAACGTQTEGLAVHDAVPDCTGCTLLLLRDQ